ncbi:deaminase [bacterium]|jgi:dCMP deaminase|nr:deaminase [bacterium]
MIKSFFLKTAYLLGQESKCVSKKVGAIIVLNGRIVSTGYNGTPPGFINCCDKFPQYNPNVHREEHHKWSLMYEIHAEMNAIAFAARNDIGIEGAEIYTILQPCDQCLKNIIAAGIKKIYYLIPYDKSTLDNELWGLINSEVVSDPDLIDWIKQQEILTLK